jgi:hypothetical protein
VEGG